jgi:endonuclease-8
MPPRLRPGAAILDVVPEGDTLRRAAEVLTPVLEGRVVTDLWFRKLRGYRPRVGDRIAGVDAVGKYLLIEFQPTSPAAGGTARPGLVLHTHLGMAGSWRATPLAASTPTSPKLRIVIETEAGRALCFSAPDISTHLAGSGTAPADRIGPDLSNDDVDLDDVVSRSRALAAADTTVAELLLNQTVAAGVGNVFKSEALFVAGIHPFTLVSGLDDEQLAALWSIAHRQLVANRERPYRSTTRPGDGGRTYVYGRHRLGCRRCDNAIAFSPAGERTVRSTYWCPSCQPAR